MIAVADAGPILHLHWVGVLDAALPSGPIRVVDAVWEELERHDPEVLASPRFERVRIALPDAVDVSLAGLDPGETEALTYALSQGDRSDVLVLCDELRARAACRSLSIPVIGSVGLIVRAFVGRCSRRWKPSIKVEVSRIGCIKQRNARSPAAIAA